jgi:hypothetical protein
VVWPNALEQLQALQEFWKRKNLPVALGAFPATFEVKLNTSDPEIVQQWQPVEGRKQETVLFVCSSDLDIHFCRSARKVGVFKRHDLRRDKV